MKLIQAELERVYSVNGINTNRMKGKGSTLHFSRSKNLDDNTLSMLRNLAKSVSNIKETRKGYYTTDKGKKSDESLMKKWSTFKANYPTATLNDYVHIMDMADEKKNADISRMFDKIPSGVMVELMLYGQSKGMTQEQIDNAILNNEDVYDQLQSQSHGKSNTRRKQAGSAFKSYMINEIDNFFQPYEEDSTSGRYDNNVTGYDNNELPFDKFFKQVIL